MACSIPMCVNVLGMFLHPIHFGWVRSAGRRGLAAFEEVVALHGVSSYIEVMNGQSDGGDVAPPQPVPVGLLTQNHNLSDVMVVLACAKYELEDYRDELVISSHFKGTLDSFGCVYGTFPFTAAADCRMRHVRLVAGRGITQVGEHRAFYGEEIKIKTVELVDFEDVRQVAVEMFFRWTKIKSIDLSPLKNVTEIGKIFMADCGRLESVDLSPLTSLISIDDGCLYSCTSLTSVNFAGMTNLAKIGVAFMKKCTRITSIDLSPLEGLTDIGHEFVSGCSRLKTVQLPHAKGLTKISRAFFAECKALRSINLTPLRAVKIIESDFLSECESLKTLDLTPLSKVKEVQEYFLDGCSSLFLRRTDNLRNAIRIALHGEAHAKYCKPEDDDEDGSSSYEDVDSDEDYDFKNDEDKVGDKVGDRLWAEDNEEFDRKNSWARGNIADLFRDPVAAARTPTGVTTTTTTTTATSCAGITARGNQCSRKPKEGSPYCFQHDPTASAELSSKNKHPSTPTDTNALETRRPPRVPLSETPPYLFVDNTSTATTPASPTSCNVLMCAGIVGKFARSVHFGWVRSAGRRGLAAFEEVVALHGVPSYIEVRGSGIDDIADNDTPVATIPQPVPLWLRTRTHNIFGGTVAIRCRFYPYDPDDETYGCEENYLISHGQTGGAASLYGFLFDRKLSRIRLFADPSVTEVGDEDDLIVDLVLQEDKSMYARFVELVGFEHVTRVREAVLYRYKHIRTLDLSPLRNVTEIGMMFLSSCSRLKSVDLSPLVNLIRIGSRFLSKNKSLVKVKLTGLKNVTTIGKYFMFGCTSLGSINLSHLEGLTEVGNHCLGRCPNVTIKGRGQLGQVLRDALKESGQ